MLRFSYDFIYLGRKTAMQVGFFPLMFMLVLALLLSLSSVNSFISN